MTDLLSHVFNIQNVLENVAGPYMSSSLCPQYAGKRLDESCLLKRNLIRQKINPTIYIEGGQPEVLDKTTGIKISCT